MRPGKDLSLGQNGQGGFLVGNYLGAVAVLPAILLVVYLATAIREAEPDRGQLWLLVLLTNAGSLTVALVLFALLQAAAVVAPHSNPQTAKAVSDAANMVFGFSLLPTGAAVSVIVVRRPMAVAADYDVGTVNINGYME